MKRGTDLLNDELIELRQAIAAIHRDIAQNRQALESLSGESLRYLLRARARAFKRGEANT